MGVVNGNGNKEGFAGGLVGIISFFCARRIKSALCVAERYLVFVLNVE